MMTYQMPGDGRGDGDQQQKRKPRRQQQAKDDAHDDGPLALDAEEALGLVQREPKRCGGDDGDDDDPIQLVDDGGRLLLQPLLPPLLKRTLEPLLISYCQY